MNRAASEQRKAAAIPRSFSFAKPRRGVRFWISSNRSGVFKFVFASISVYTNPGFKLFDIGNAIWTQDRGKGFL